MATLPNRPVGRKAENATATMRAGWALCRFAYGSCQCHSKGEVPCDSVAGSAREIIDAVKDELAEKYVLRKRPGTQAS